MRKAAPWAVAVLLAVVVGFAVQASAVARQRRDNDAHRADVQELELRLDFAADDLDAAHDRNADLRDRLVTTRDELGEARETIRKNERSIERLASTSLETLSVLEAKADCIDVVIDSYNQYVYYEDIGIALERALDSEACRRAGVT